LNYRILEALPPPYKTTKNAKYLQGTVLYHKKSTFHPGESTWETSNELGDAQDFFWKMGNERRRRGSNGSDSGAIGQREGKAGKL